MWAAAWMSLEDVMLSKVSQFAKTGTYDNIYMRYLDESDWGGSSPPGEERMRSCLMGTVSVLQDEKDVELGCTTV